MGSTGRSPTKARLSMIKLTRGILTTITAAVVWTGTLTVADPALAAVDHYEVQVDGLACPFCAYGLEKKLKKLPGATHVQIELNTGWASFDVSSGVLLPDPVRGAVRDAGFTPREIRVTASGSVQGEGDELRLDVGEGQALGLYSGKAFEKLRALVKKGRRDLVVTGVIERVGGAWQLRVSEVEPREAP